ncbi:MAG: 3-deoxy-D-manno-octulosonic acid transferase, partial [Muribaculaceae bacterium]|nr:3-deoxy-D-manno-octulosonic acid transferase [Muribaculaceae bacterium]
WFHAASLGEFEQARPLIDTIRKEKNDAKILLTFFSPSGYEVRKEYPQVTTVAYLPSDTADNARWLLDIARPRKVVFVKYEFWINLLTELKRRGIDTYLISAIFRPGQIFFKPWGGLFRKALHCYNEIFVQNDESRRLLASIGVTNVTVAGDTRFDRVREIRKNGKSFPLIETWKGDEYTIVAGSSWGPDELRYIPWLNDHPKNKAIIAPHEFDQKRLDEIRSMLTHPSMLWSDVCEGSEIPESVQTVIVDTFGILSSLYRYADTVLIGGGFGAGIHNINEAAVWGVPVLFGPNHKKFKEATDLLNAGGAFQYHTTEDAANLLTLLKNDECKRKEAADIAARYIEENIGASDLILKTIL